MIQKKPRPRAWKNQAKGPDFNTKVQLKLDDGLVLQDATKAFPDLAERYVRSNDDTEVEST
ncbi:hypothetical protein DOM22_02665 [Bdellovibrio sp. ZAP7]|nr:hypothetical protein DOM22_02665 [Bdellovibrio sp. ZAP7]